MGRNLPLSLLNFARAETKAVAARARAFDTWLHMNANFAECLFSSEVSFQTCACACERSAVECECNLRSRARAWKFNSCDR
jgi:hypothetical protein